jgi:asparagine synthase (glutamine-hydrolysing)
MCGIVGFLFTDRSPGGPSEDRRVAALGSIAHRGPDSYGDYSDRGVWLGHRRLSILDLSDSGCQPMPAADGSQVICYNGEVYNFRELARDLRLENLHSTSDTEVVLRAFAARGSDSFRLLNGMFAFALHDRVARKVWLVRDRLGIKPLYLRVGSGSLAFASEIKALHALDGSAPECDPAVLHEWLYYGAGLGGRTLHHGVRQLPPGHFLEFDLATGRTAETAYWSLASQAAEVDTTTSTAELITRTRTLLEDAVRRQLVSDVPVGVFLSGGIDSSAITAFASRHHTGRLATFSAGFDFSRGLDERPRARRIAEHFGTEHHEFEIAGSDVGGVVEQMVTHHDAPFGDAANIPLYLMSRQLGGRAKVMLQGDGGDEVFGGYRRYKTIRYHRLLRFLAGITLPLSGLVPDRGGLHYRVRRYLAAHQGNDLGLTMARLLTFEDPDSDPLAIFSREWRGLLGRTDPFARYRACQRSVAQLDVGSQMSLVDLLVELPDVFLEKVDRATMAASVEVRVPFLDHELVDFVARIDGRRKMPGGRKKWLLKQALRGVVPDEVLDGPKLGFNVPFADWLRTSLRSQFLDHLATFQRRQGDLLDRAVVERWYADFCAGRNDRSHLLWKVHNFLIWSNNSHVTFPSN